MLLTSDPVSPIWPIPSDVILMCTVELSPSVDILVTVNTEWSGPDRITIPSNDTVMQNLTVYISTVVVRSFGRNQSGNYNCTASVSSTSRSAFVINIGSLSGTTKVTTGNSNVKLVANNLEIIAFGRCISLL